MRSSVLMAVLPRGGGGVADGSHVGSDDEDNTAGDQLHGIDVHEPEEPTDRIGGTVMSSFGCQVSIKPKQRTKYCQTKERKTTKQQNDKSVKMRSIGVQTESSKPVQKDAFQIVRPDYFEKEHGKTVDQGTVINSDHHDDSGSADEPFSSPMKDDHSSDPLYIPNLSSESSDEDNSAVGHKSMEEHPKYLVFQDNLLELFNTCPKCCSSTNGQIQYTNGSLVKIKQVCKTCLYIREWFSQPFVRSMPAGNLLMSASILFSGSIPSKALKMFSFMKLSCVSISTYIIHQNRYLYPAIQQVWQSHKQTYMEEVKATGRAVNLGGDGRSDSPGHSAKYGSYTMLDLDKGVVVDIQLVQSNEVKSSVHMEKEGLKRSVEYFQRHNVKITTLITDRHVQIVKWVRENMPDTTHHFDVWHVAKGLKKKLFALSKLKDCSYISPWIKSLVNHLYWTAASSHDQNVDMILAKWESVLNHVINVHSGHSPLFEKCQHDPLVGIERQKKWLQAGSLPFEKLTEIVCSRQMKKDVPKLSPGQQTSAVEGYHSVVNHFAPKMIGFSYNGQLSRLLLAALHYGENSKREQAYTLGGKPRYDIVYPKYKKGEYTIRKILVKCTYEYVDCLLKTVFEFANTKARVATLPLEVPPPLCSQYERPDKQSAIQSLSSRFSQCQRHDTPDNSDQDQESSYESS